MKTKLGFILFGILFNTIVNYSNAQSIQVDCNGQVGIGTGTPENSENWDKVLDVHGTDRSKIITTTNDIHTGIWSHNYAFYSSPAGGISGTWSNHPFTLISNKTPRLTVLANGNIGVGTLSPENSDSWDRVFDVYGSGKSKIIATTSSIQTGLWSSNSAIYEAPSGGITGTFSNHPFSLVTNKLTRLTILANGNIGIGTTSPSSIVDINYGSNLVKFYSTSGYGTSGVKISTYYGSSFLDPLSNNKGELGFNYYWNTLHVTQIYSPNGISSGSDERFKENIQQLTSPLAKVLELKGVKYDLKPEMFFGKDQVSNVTESQLKNHIGLIAQEVQEIIPEVVLYDSARAMLGIKYTELIPYLIEAIKEQQLIITSMQDEISELRKQTADESILKSGVVADAKSGIQDIPLNALFQNSPNPFSSNTIIEYTLADNAKTAMICIYDLNGAQLKCILLDITESGQITISANELKAGMYLYSLLVDGNLIDTKRMILTD
ncbi:MAG: tail fiber domain-containing protein [Bacteroidales bacterium]